MKNIEDQPKITRENRDDQLGVKSIGYTVRKELSQEAKNMFEKLNNQENLIDYRRLNFRGGNNVDYNFTNVKPLREFFRAIYYGEVLIPGAEREGEQDEFNDMLKLLKKYRPNTPKYVKSKKDLLINAQNFYDGREMIIDAFKDKLFPLNNLNDFPHYVSEEDISPRSESPSHSEDITPRSESPGHSEDISPRSESPSHSEDISPRTESSSHSENKLNEMITKKEKIINRDLLRKYFKDRDLIYMQRDLYDTRNREKSSHSEFN